MMYLTAHRIRLKNRKTGVNAFLNLHGLDFAWPSNPVGLLSLLRTDPGTPTQQKIGIPSAGGNAVLAVLDVVAPDVMERSIIIELLDLLVAVDPEVHGGHLALVRAPIALRLSLPQWSLEGWRKELERLASPLESLLRSRSWRPETRNRKNAWTDGRR